MKRIVFILIAILIATSSFAVKSIKGDSNSYLDEYKVSQLNGNLFELSYANSTETFTIEVCPEKDKCCYLVRGDKVEVMYLCNESGLGLRKMPEKSQQISTDEYCKLVDCKAFSYQSLLTPEKKDTKSALGIIACFFPHVVNEDSRSIVFTPQNELNQPRLTMQE